MLFGGGFNKGGGLFNPKKGPTIIEQVDMLFKDVETEGKKQGYTKAANEYEKVFVQVERDYENTKKFIQEQMNSLNKKTDDSIIFLQKLEQEKLKLEQQLEERATRVSRKYNMNTIDVKRAAMSGTLFMPNTSNMMLDIIYRHKEKKLRDAEQRGYLEAKELYERKIASMRAQLNALKEKGSNEIKQYHQLIADIFNEISKLQLQIADLNILL